MRKASFYTLGCKVNQYETQALKEQLEKMGYEIVEENQFADIYIINTCTVTNLSDKKSRQLIRRAKRLNEDSVVVVIGCYAQVSPEEVKAIEGVNIVAGTNEKNNVIKYIEDYYKDDRQLVKVQDTNELVEFEEMFITGMEARTRAFIKIQEGCNQFCSYCIIPYARGSVRSRKLQDITNEAKGLVAKGYKEIVITGINAALYGQDNDEGTLIDVIEGINEIEGSFRIRFSSIEPAVIQGNFERLFNCEKLCSHIHLSLQSGSNHILKLMNRKYTKEEYIKVVEKLREKRPGFSVTTDIIVGFPNESEEDFQESCKIVEDVAFGKVHVFKYSKRDGTVAADMKNQVEPAIKSKRSEELISLSSEVAIKFNEANIGKTTDVLFEMYNEKTGYYEGLTDNYIRVFCESEIDIRNKFAEVILEKIYDDGLIGKISKIN